jgi:uncharacterized protein (TIGR03435 family)
MPEPDDHQLLGEFARTESEPAFAELVARYVNLVYSTALRFTGNAHHAEEIAQAVFIILARKAAGLSSRVVLSGWLYQTTRLTAANFMKGEIRRQQREQEVYMQSLSNESNDAAWQEIAPLLDEAMGRLGKTDRDAVVLRFFENKNSAEIGAVLRMNEESARRRVNRALEKLRKFFTKRGVNSTTAIIASQISANSVGVAPVGLAKTISAGAVAKGAAASTSTLTLVKGAMKLMAWTKVQTAIVAGIGILLVAGTTTVTVAEIQEHKTYAWEVPRASFAIFYKMPPTIKIVPTKFDKNGDWCCDSSKGAMGIAQPLKEIVQIAYRKSAQDTVIETDLPTNRYDFFAKQTKNEPEEIWAVKLQNEIVRQFGIKGSLEIRNQDALVLRPCATGAINFKVSHKMLNGIAVKPTKTSFSAYEQPIGTLTSFLQYNYQTLIVDQTGLTKKYDFGLKWNQSDSGRPNLDDLKQALSDQLGLELISTNMPVETLVIKKAG